MTTIPRLYIFLMLGASLVIGGCQSDEQPTDVNINIPDEFEVLMEESLSETAHSLKIHIQTIDRLECTNYSIAHTLNQNTNKISFSINNVVEPVDCIEGSAPAEGYLDLGRFISGEYDMEVNLRKNEIVNKAKLTINDDQYTIALESEYGIAVPYYILNRVPTGAVWGYLDFEHRENANAAWGDFNMILEALSEYEWPLSGEYGHFYIDGNTITTVQDGKEKVFSELFFFSNVTDTASLATQLESLRNTYPEVTFRLFLWDGTRL